MDTAVVNRLYLNGAHLVQATVVPKDLDVDVPFGRPLSLCDPSLINAILFLDTLPCFRPLTDYARRTVFPDRIGKQESGQSRAHFWHIRQRGRTFLQKSTL